MNSKRAKNILGTKLKPRLAVYRSLHHIYSQLIDDEAGRTLVCASTLEKVFSTEKSKKSVELALKVGQLLAKRAKENGIAEVVFDRRDRVYHGRVKAIADGAREGGLKF